MTSTSMDRRVTTKVEALVARVREIVQRGLEPSVTASLVAHAIRPSLAEPRLLLPHQQTGSRDRYTQHLLHVEPGGSFSIVALVWLPGQATAIHDHVSWCSVGVYRGEETEIQYRLAGHGPDERLEVTERLVNERGSVSGIAPPGDIHQVMNTGAGRAISIHVYGADVGALGSSIRRTYDHPIGR